MNYSITVTKEALNELEQLKLHDPDSHAAILVLLEQFNDDQCLLEDLMLPGIDAEGDPTFEKKIYETARRAGYNILILKFHTLDGELSSHRVLIGLDSQKGKYYVLSIPARDINYESDRIWLADLYRRYEECGVPIYK